MTKRAPEMTWQDKAILIVIPVVVFVIFIVANYVSDDVSIAEAIERKANDLEVRDVAVVASLLPSVATTTQLFRARTRDGKHEFTFQFNIPGSDTIPLEPGRQFQFVGRYRHDAQGGIVEAPFKKIKQNLGWVIYDSKRYYFHEN